MRGQEIEIKVRVGDAGALKAFLLQSAIHLYDQDQYDEYFVPAHRDFLAATPTKEWLRLRKENGSCSINYKNWQYAPGSNISDYNIEHETKLGDLESARNILIALDFKSICVVDKKRSAYKWNDYEVALDTVKNLGDFVEVEYKSEKEVDPKETTNKMLEFLKGLNCGEIKRVTKGYPYMILFGEEK